MRILQGVKPAFWGAIFGAVVIMMVGFSWWGWTLGSTAESMARQQADAAVTAVLTPICVENFLAQADAAAKLAELQKTASWQQSQFVEKGGWATAPGSTTPNAAVARACGPADEKQSLVWPWGVIRAAHSPEAVRGPLMWTSAVQNLSSVIIGGFLFPSSA